MYLDICYLEGVPENAVKIAVPQNKKSVRWTSENRSAYYPPAYEFTQASNNGERIDLVFPGDRIDSSELTIRIDTPDSQHAETVFALESLRQRKTVVRDEKPIEQKMSQRKSPTLTEPVRMGHPRKAGDGAGAGSVGHGANLIVVAGIVFTEEEFAAVARQRVGGVGSVRYPSTLETRAKVA